MPQVDKESYGWETAAETDDSKYRGESSTMESQRVVKSNRRLGTHFSMSSNESSGSDDGSTASSNLNDQIQEESLTTTTTTNESAPNLLTFNHENLFARRKISTCSNISSTNSTCHSVDGAGSESEINSTCYNCDFDAGSTVPSIDNCDEIIDQMVGLKFSQNKSTSTRERKEGPWVGNNKLNEEDRATESTENLSNGNNKVDDVNGNYEAGKDDASANGSEESEESEDDEDLVERGPVRPHNNAQSHHEKPYYTLNWVASNGKNADHNQFYMSDYETVSEIVDNKELYDQLNPYIDKLSNNTEFNQSYFNDFNAVSGWSTPELSYAEAGTPNSNFSGDDTVNGPAAAAAAIPSIVLADGESSILEKLTSGAYQAARSMCDTASSHHPSPGGPSLEHWPDSPASGRQREEMVELSRSHSRASSGAHSPGSSANIGSPLLQQNICASINSHQLQPNMGNFRVCRGALSSSESSNHSFGDDASSPLSYEHDMIDRKPDEQLSLDFDSFLTSYPNYMSSDTLVNTAEIIDAIVNNEIQRAEGAANGDDDCVKENKLLQKSYDSYEPETFSPGEEIGSNRSMMSDTTNFRTQCKQNRTIDNIFDDVIASETHKNESKIVDASVNLCSVLNGGRNYRLCEAPEVAQIGDTRMVMNAATDASGNLVAANHMYDINALTYSQCIQNNNPRNNTDPFSSSANSVENIMDFNSTIDNLLKSHYADSSSAIINSRIDENDDRNFNASRQPAEGNISPPSTFNEFQIPETVSAFRQNHLRRNTDRHVAAPPWPCLNLPETAASERLKAGLDPREVEKAMKDLLKRPPEELAAVDEDGDTMLMCLVGNPRELEKKKAYLVPLVERLGNVHGSLTKTNNRNEDALYIAAMYCPQMAYVTGYLAAAMLQRNIDIGQRLYHHGDTLVHVMAAKGDTHASVMAELLALKTAQGNTVFDLSQRNYSGRTPLHTAVESHDPTGSGVSCIGVIQLLLQNGADQKIDEIEYRNTALHTAVSLCRDPALVKILLSNNGHGVVNMPNGTNDTPVHLAFALSDAVPITRQIQVCMDLIQAGGQTNIRNGEGKSPLALVIPERRETIRSVFFKKNNFDRDFIHR